MIIRSFLIFILALSNFTSGFSQNDAIIYLFPGQGSDARIFDSLNFKSDTKIVDIKYPIPEKGSSLSEYARRISSQIDTSKNYIFIGVSLGGMIISELNDFLNPEKAIVISSAKCRSELPIGYRIQKVIPIYKKVPPRLILASAKFLQPIIEPDRNVQKATFKSMLASKDPIYMKRTVAMIIEWDRKKARDNIIHIHGSKDRTIPIRNVKYTEVIQGGSHMMTLTQPFPINNIISDYLNQ